MLQDLVVSPTFSGMADCTALTHPHTVAVPSTGENYALDVAASIPFDCDIEPIRREDQVGIGSSTYDPADTVFLKPEDIVFCPDQQSLDPAPGSPLRYRDILNPSDAHIPAPIGGHVLLDSPAELFFREYLAPGVVLGPGTGRIQESVGRGASGQPAIGSSRTTNGSSLLSTGAYQV